MADALVRGVEAALQHLLDLCAHRRDEGVTQAALQQRPVGERLDGIGLDPGQRLAEQAVLALLVLVEQGRGRVAGAAAPGIVALGAGAAPVPVRQRLGWSGEREEEEHAEEHRGWRA